MNTATLEEIADAILRLTYGDMMRLANGIGEFVTELLPDNTYDADVIASILNAWAITAAENAEATE